MKKTKRPKTQALRAVDTVGEYLFRAAPTGELELTVRMSPQARGTVLEALRTALSCIGNYLLQLANGWERFTLSARTVVEDNGTAVIEVIAGADIHQFRVVSGRATEPRQ